MDRNSIIGLLLIGAILIGYTIWTAPGQEELARQAQMNDSIAQVQADQARAIAEQENVRSVPDSTLADIRTPPDTLRSDSVHVDSLRNAALIGRQGILYPAATGTDQVITIANDALEIGIHTKGARPGTIRLKDYRTYGGEPLLLQDPDSVTYAYRFFLGKLDLSTQDLYFVVDEQGPGTVRLRASTDDPGKYIAISYHLDSTGFFLHSAFEMVGLEKEVDPADLFFQWDLSGQAHEKYLPTERQKCGVYYKYFNDDRDYLSETKDDEKDLSGRTNWVAFKQDFFSVAMVSDKGFAGSGSKLAIRTFPEDSTHTKRYSAKLFFDKHADDRVQVPMRIYLGPNHFGTLRRTGIDQFARIIDLGWGIFGWMNRWLVIPIFNWLDGWGWNYGIIILVLTLAIKLLLMPLTYRNFKSSARMRALKPEMDAINTKFMGGDNLKKQQAVMDLYRKAGVNPASGCVPMLIQLPILYAMFRFFPASIELRQKSFLWADDLSSYDSILHLPFNIPFYGDHVSLFTLLMAASTIIYTQINQQQMPQQQGMPSMKVMIWMFPIMMLFFLNNYSAGLSYYYLLANVISILQMTVIKRWLVDEDKLRAELLSNMKKPKRKSRWQQRLEDLQKQQQQQARRR
ncbi:MAG: membrane protein insertase YidC [Flavobacteriales bacterium]|nr:membrane protein insertase YidC [Flavobacteriales bacterium]MCB9167646.1 membrane protein insertase YidC [Flavobacteriales bacterium]